VAGHRSGSPAVLPYDAVREAADPAGTLRVFYDSAYQAGARTAWEPEQVARSPGSEARLTGHHADPGSAHHGLRSGAVTGKGLLERDTAVAALRGALGRACRDDDGSVQLVVGAAGLGKTALLDVVRDLAGEHDALVLSARASELDRGFGFGLVHQLLEPVVHGRTGPERARLFAGAAGRATTLFDGGVSLSDEPEYGVLSGLYWLIANLADERPVVLRVDDLHWADVASLRMLELLARRIEGLPVLLAGTLRPDEPGAHAELLDVLLTLPATERIEPAPLSAGAAGTLLEAALAGPVTASFRDAAWHATAGNPLLLSILAREAATQGLRGRDEEAEQLTSLAARGVRPIAARRLAGLGAEDAGVAKAAAVLGDRSRVEDLAALTGLDGGSLGGSLTRLAAAGLLVVGTTAYAHPLLRSAVLESLADAERARLHRRAAQVLRERGAAPAEIALHWLAVAPAADPQAARDLRAAAQAAAAEGAASTAADLLRRAVDEGAAEDRATLLFELADLELGMLRPDGAERMREALAAGLDDRLVARARAALGTVLLLSDPVAGFAEIAAARAGTGDERLRLRLEAAELEALVFVDALGDARRERYAAITADPEPSVAALAHLASELALRGAPVTEVEALAARAAAGDRLLDELGPGGSTWSLLTHALRFAERPDAARRLLVAGDRVVRERGLRAAGAFNDQSWGYWHRDFGSAARGLAHAQAGYDAIVETALPVSVAAVVAVVAENLVLLDRHDEAATLMDLPLEPVRDTFVEVFALTARGLTRMMTGRDAGAESDLRRVVAILDARGWHAPSAARGRLRLAELLAARGDRTEARELIAHDVHAAQAAGTCGSLGMALRVRALTEDGGARLATLERAVATLDASPLLLERGRALLDLGSALRERGDRARARDVLRGALDLASRTESAWLARLVRAELHASGARPRRERTSGVEALTPSERRVADLAAEGLTNREIAESLWVTPKTVEYHLSRVYTKLGITMRQALSGALDGSSRAAA
jgi:DNA-binding CsgD family transcriptional regulator